MMIRAINHPTLKTGLSRDNRPFTKNSARPYHQPSLSCGSFLSRQSIVIFKPLAFLASIKTSKQHTPFFYEIPPFRAAMLASGAFTSVLTTQQPKSSKSFHFGLVKPDPN